ncbi:MAG: hypothetical protein MJ113_08145, partial [Lachnospiraceae bacterium]|nr:hypothetical protein [Lachnospiraceae bacterium]
MNKNDEKDPSLSVSQEYNFFEEHVRKKKKSKVKKRIIQILFTLLCAVLFGLVSSYIIIVSDSWFETYLGIKEKTGKEKIGLDE